MPPTGRVLARPVSVSCSAVPIKDNGRRQSQARALARLRACLGLPSASAPGFVDRARPARDDVARLDVARPRSASSRPIHGVRSDGSAGDPVVPNRVVLHLGNADALCRPTAARYRPPLPAQFRPDARRERTLLARATTWSMREMFRNESSCANLNHVCCVELFEWRFSVKKPSRSASGRPCPAKRLHCHPLRDHQSEPRGPAQATRATR
jgi:hypothetical protein